MLSLLLVDDLWNLTQVAGGNPKGWKPKRGASQDGRAWPSEKQTEEEVTMATEVLPLRLPPQGGGKQERNRCLRTVNSTAGWVFHSFYSLQLLVIV